ncbi:hypothetical protein D3C84_1081570 [compost metagenome]
MNRIDHELGRQLERFEHATRLHRHRMRRGVLHGQLRAVRFAMIEHARQFMHLLVQAAAKRHVHFLEATADAEYRNARRNGCTQ